MHAQQAEDDAAAELGAAAVKAEHGEHAYITVPDGAALPADKQSIKGLSYTQAFGIYKVPSHGNHALEGPEGLTSHIT